MRAGADLAERHPLLDGPRVQDRDQAVEHAARGGRVPASVLAELVGVLRGGPQYGGIRR